MKSLRRFIALLLGLAGVVRAVRPANIVCDDLGFGDTTFVRWPARVAGTTSLSSSEHTKAAAKSPARHE